MTKCGVIKLEEIRIDPNDPTLKPAKGPTGSRHRVRAPKHFVMVPLGWVARLEGASGQVYRLALVLLFLHWKGNNKSVKLANRAVGADGIPPQTKRRALRELENRGLVRIDWRERCTAEAPLPAG
jgi:hypothetical protein